MDHPFKAIKATFSLNLSLKIIALVAAATAVSGAVFYAIAGQVRLDSGYGPVISGAGAYKAMVLERSIYIYAVFTAFTLAGVLALSVIYSHRVAGPLHRVKAVSREIAKGRLNVGVKFREHDVIHPLGESINAMSLRYRERFERLGKGADDMKALAASFDAAVKSGDRASIRDAVLSLSSKSKEIENLLGEIKL